MHAELVPAQEMAVAGLLRTILLSPNDLLSVVHAASEAHDFDQLCQEFDLAAEITLYK
nr:hypothetical protein [Simplicispira psychrophila]